MRQLTAAQPLITVNGRFLRPNGPPLPKPTRNSTAEDDIGTVVHAELRTTITSRLPPPKATRISRDLDG